MKTRRPLAKLTALILSLAMTLTLLTGMTTAPGQKDYCAHVCGDGTCLYAQGADCDENDDEEYVHVHDADCGYIEPVSCDHVCGDDCAEIPPGLSNDEPGGEASDIIDDETTPEQDDCAHVCGEGLCAFDEGAGIDCDHVCDDDCTDSSGLTDETTTPPISRSGIMPLSDTPTGTFNLAAGTGTGTGWEWNSALYILTVQDGANITVTGTVANLRRIIVAANATASITLNNVSISGLDGNSAAIGLNDNANLTLTITGDNTLTGSNAPGINVPDGRTLTINGDGSLTANGGSNAAGIGGHLYSPSGGSITITGGTITANGGNNGAGIGGGSGGDGGNITITGGNIAATGNGGAGIGGGNGGDGGTIKITSGTVTANGVSTGAGIGGGNGGDGGTIEITGGTITASGGSGGAGIGGGFRITQIGVDPIGGNGGTITISGTANVEAQGSGNGAGIGGGGGNNANNGGAGGTITINGGTVTATSGNGNGAGIGGGGGSSSGGTLAMDGNALVYASRLANNNANGQTNTSGVTGGILFDGDDGTVYGNVELEDDLTIEPGQTLTIPGDASLTVPGDVTLTNEGTINNGGTITNDGTIENDGAINNGGTIIGTINGDDVTEIPEPVIATTSLPDGIYNTAYTQTLEATGGNITWSVSDGALPGGLTLNAATGVISGTPTAADTFTFTVKAENVKSSDEVEFTVVIAPAAGSFVSPAALNTTYTPTLTLADVTPATGYAWVTPSTPIPNAGDNQSFPATYTDPSGNSLPATGNITVNVAKAAAPANVNTTRSFPAGTGDTQHVNLPTLLPTVAGSFGNPVSYTAVITDNTLGANLTAPTGTVSSPAAMAIIVASTATAGQSATITVTVTSQNYADFDIVITVNIMDKMPTTVTVTPLADITYGDTLGNPTAVADAGDVGTFTFLYTGTLNMGAGYNPYSSADKPTAPGTYAVRATLISDTHTGAATSAEFTIARKQLTWSNGIVQNKTYDGHTVATIATPPTLIGIINNDTVNVSSGMVLFASANVGTHEITANIFGIANSGDGWKYITNGQQPIFSNASITRANQDTLTVDQPGPLTFGASPITLSTTGGSGDGAVSFTVVSGPGTVSGSTLTITGAGNIVVNATKAGGTNHNATTSANITITVNQARIPTAMIAVTSPVRGNAPNTSAMITGGGGFTAGAVSWSGSPSFFLPETQYTVTVTLAAQQGFTFTGGLATATINGQNATVSNNTGANVTLSYEFPATAAAEAPGAPQSFTATAGNGQVTLSWSAPANNGGSAITKYEVSSDDGATWTDASSGAGHTFTGLTNGTAYTFKVRAVNSVGEGAEATATATPVVPTYSLIVANGTGSGSFTAGTQVTITASAAPLGQVFDSWTGGNGGAFASASSATTTFTMPANAATVTATYRSSGGNNQVGSGGSSSSGSGIIGAITSLFTPANAPQTVTQAAANTATQNAVAAAIAEGSTTATANIKNPGEISVSNLQAMAATASEAGMESIRLQADSMTANNRAVDVRITLDPAQSTQDLNLSASTTNAQATRTTNTFTRFFSNDVMTVSLGQQGDFGQTVTIAARLNPELNTDNLAFYAYDRETNTYKQIREPNYRIDSNGYVHFQTALAGDIVISDGALSRR